MGSLDKFINAAARNYKVSPEYLRKLIQYESKGDPNAISPTGAKGLGQFTSDTAREYGLNRRNINDPGANIDATARLARNNRDQFTKIMGREPTDDELYLTHLQGVAGATRGLRNPGRPAAELWPEAVRFNLPPGAKGRINTITAQEYQELHKAGFNRQGAKSSGTIDITDQPTLKTLNPPTIDRSKKGDPLKPISSETLDWWRGMTQSSPTEESTVARHPSFEQAINSSLDKVSEQDPRRVRYAGSVTSTIAKTPKVKRTISPANQAVKDAAEKETGTIPKGDGPYNRTDPSSRGMEGTYEDYVKREQDKFKGVAKRDAELRSVPSAGEQIGSGVGSSADIVPKSVKTIPIGPPAALGATGVGAAAVGAGSGDPAVDVVRKSIDGGDFRDPMSGAPMPGRSSPRTSAGSQDPNFLGGIAQIVAPVIKQVASDPVAGPALQTVVKKAVEVQATRDAQRADMRNDPTYYQQMASRGQAPGAAGPSGSGDPLDDRAMERAVMMDNASRGVAPQQQASQLPQRGRPKVSVPPKDQAQVPTTEEQIVAQAIPQGAEKGDTRPSYPSVPPGSVRTPAMYDPTAGSNIPQPNAPPPPMDPIQQLLMQFYTQGGSTGGGVMP